jgi:hypothetical protein
MNSYNINPLLPGSFPFASQMTSFEEYEPVGLVLCYEPASGFLSSNQAVGTVQIFTQYDLQDPLPGTQTEALDYEFSTTFPPFEAAVHPIECNPRQNQLARFYLRNGLLAGTSTTFDARYNSYDLGRVSIATAGVPAAANTVLGKLFWSYHFRYHKPKLGGGLTGLSILHDQYPIVGTYIAGTSAVMTGLVPSALSSTSTLGTTLTWASGTLTLTFPPFLNLGSFLVIISFNAATGVGLTNLSPNTGTFNNCTQVGYSDSGLNSFGTGAGNLVGYVAVRVNGTNASIAWTTSNTGFVSTTTGTSSTGSFGVEIMQCSNTIF